VKSIFITATGTDVGKTYVSGLLVKKMRELGFNCGYFKPVLSGAIRLGSGELVPEDCKHVVETSGLKVRPIDCLSYCFDEAVSPHLAAKRKGVTISLRKILDDFETQQSKYDYMVVEGAGGITCPLIDTPNKSEMVLMSDLIRNMNQEVLIVADGGLGTINSVLTTVEFTRANGIQIKGIILNNFDKSDFMHRDNLYMIEKMTDIRVVATVEKNGKELIIESDKLESLFNEV
jgi:dethiobiotin synthetase